MKKATNSKKSVKSKDKSSGSSELRKPSKLKPIKSKEVKRSKNAKAFEDDDEINPDEFGGLDDFDTNLELDDEDDF